MKIHKLLIVVTLLLVMVGCSATTPIYTESNIIDTNYYIPGYTPFFWSSFGTDGWHPYHPYKYYHPVIIKERPVIIKRDRNRERPLSSGAPHRPNNPPAKHDNDRTHERNRR